MFIAPVLYGDARAKSAAKILRQVEKGERPAATSSLTIDEITWVLWKKIGREGAVKAAQACLALPHLRVLSVTGDHAQTSLTLMKRHASLRPRDAIHAAVALGNQIKTIVSDDHDFDVIAALKRESPW